MEREDKGLNIHARRTIAYIVLALVSILCLFWFYVLIINATRSHSQITMGFSPVPGTSFLKNWDSLVHGTLPMFAGLRNSVIISVCSAILTTYFSAMTAYGIHAYRFVGRKAITTFILGVMMIPTQVTALGFIKFIQQPWMTKLHLGMDSYGPLIIPTIAAPAIFFYMKQYMDSALPMSLVESARIDGAGELRTFNSIVLPIMKPAISVQAIFGFVSSWNNYFTPALVLQTDTKKTLPILIAQLRAADFLKFDMGQVYMMILFSIAPVVVVYLILSKQIVGGVAVGAVKG